MKVSYKPCSRRYSDLLFQALVEYVMDMMEIHKQIWIFIYTNLNDGRHAKCDVV